MNAVERREVSERRKLLGHRNIGSSEKVQDAVGLALSGGGIRSATFCLGVVQTLARRKLFKEVDLISTVSGGGYFGSFLSTFLGVDIDRFAGKRVGAIDRIKLPAECAAREKQLFEGGDLPESPALRHLRTSSKYLLNGGGLGQFTILGLLLSGVTTNLLMLLPFSVFAAIGVAVLWHAGLWSSFAVLRWLWILPATIFAVYWVLLPSIQSRTAGAMPGTPAQKLRIRWETCCLITGFFTLCLLGVCFLPEIFHLYDYLKNLSGKVNVFGLDYGAILTALTGASSLLLGPLALKRSPNLKGSHVRLWAMKLFVLSGPLFFILIFLLVGNRLQVGQWPIPDATLSEIGIVALTTVILVVWGFSVNINTLAPHRFYRARLCECYLTVKSWTQRTALAKFYDWLKLGRPVGVQLWEEAENGIGTIQMVPLTTLGEIPAAPYHIINTVVNLPSSNNSEVKGRGGDFFQFSKHFCGSPVVGYVATSEMEKLDPHLDLGTAMAISGAAASTNMGWKTMKNMRFLLALLNVRLGYWVPNPSFISDSFTGKPGVGYFVRELMGWMHERMSFLNLSDGGHIENLAAYELLRRRCKFIVCVDAGMEPGMECADLMRLERYAKIDLGIQMHFDPADLTVLPTQYSRAYAVLVKIDYKPSDDPQVISKELGWMLYIKLAVTGIEPRYVLDYRRENPDFPHQSTGDQLYDEAQFEAYRALGECAAESLFSREILGENEPKNTEAWFQALADSLLPDNDQAFLQ